MTDGDNALFAEIERIEKQADEILDAARAAADGIRRKSEADVAELAAALPEQEFGDVELDRIVLMKSELRPTGAVYTVLEAFPLGG